MSIFKAGVLALTTLLLLTYFGFTKANPFANPYELKAMFRDAQNLKPRSPVRIAGVEVGKVTKVESKDGGGAAEVTMQLRDDALPLHDDARLQIRSRIFLEGNFFVDIQPGSPSAGDLADGSTVPITQTASTVTLPEILDTLDSDVRGDLQTLLYEYGTVALQGGGAKAFNRAIPSFEPAYRYGALTNDALLGVDPDRDIQRLLRGQQRTFAALADNPRALEELVTDLNTTAGAIAAHDSALEAAVPALRDTLREGYPALGELNAALPTLRTFAREALPGVRSSTPALAAATPWMIQARGLVQESELKGLSRDLRFAVPSLVRLNSRLVPFLSQLRALSSCTNSVLVPFMESEIPSIEEGNSGHSVREQINRSFVGLAGESRVNDANTPVFHIQGVNPFKLATGKVEPAPPPDTNMPPPHRPDVPCETQEPPNLSAPGGDATLYGGGP
ncbi:MAG: phospholipid/cholesterol/gamma-HCH transport system substrate-binding protein [Thermoleophilaceae bacterium]|jgi:virulence factor Mce-like protein|nr:phospholipid/cholesterol/gamma-HCH transport system substrate-binding protein [Thermoleophilaceae bacterium]